MNEIEMQEMVMKAVEKQNLRAKAHRFVAENRPRIERRGTLLDCGCGQYDQRCSCHELNYACDLILELANGEE